MKAEILHSERLLLKPLSLEHLSEMYVQWMNDPDVNQYLETGGDYTLEKLKTFLTEVESNDILFWGIHVKSNDLHIGNIKIDPVNEKHGLCEYGILMGNKSEWGKGYAKEASLRIIDYCFNDLGLRKMTLGVIEDNLAAVNLYKKLGFITEGRYLNHGIYQNRYRNSIRMALFNPLFSYDF